jgi:hypothetical protein
LKKYIVLFPILIVFALFLSSCEGSLNNEFTFRNESAGKLFINFRANIVEVPVGQIVTIKDVPRGTYAFSTTYELPGNAVSSTVQGDASGQVNFNTGTRVLILFSSTLSEDFAYTLFATLTTTEDLTVDEGPTEP